MFFIFHNFFLGTVFVSKERGTAATRIVQRKYSVLATRVYRKDSPSCGGTCATYGQCKGDEPQIEGCACPGIKVLTANVSKIQFLSKAVSYRFHIVVV